MADDEVYKTLGNHGARITSLEKRVTNIENLLQTIIADLQVLKDLVTTVRGFFDAWKWGIGVCLTIGSAAVGAYYFIRDLGLL